MTRARVPAVAAALSLAWAGAWSCDGGRPHVLADVQGGTADDGGAAAPDGAGSVAEAGPPPLDVLFIGNSYTYVNDLPGQLAALAKTSHEAPSIATSSVTAGGETLGNLWEAGAAPQAIAAGHFTHVVLQEQSETPACDPATFDQYAALFASAARAQGATPALYETWARADGSADFATYPCLGGTPAAMQDLLLSAYRKAATDDSAVLVPVGEAWRSVRASYPSIVLFQSDGSHPSLAGTYLSACVFYVTLTGHAVPASAAVPAGVDPGDAAHLRDVALAVAAP